MDDFHFLRPEWLIALLPCIALAWYLKQHQLVQSSWHKFIPAHLATKLISNSNQVKQFPLYSLILLWSVIVLALAGPAWEKRPQPVFSADIGRVILFDLSMSMRSEDLKPDRLTQARFKAIDLSRQITEGELGLVAYAGDAFTISPLTPDSKNVAALLPSLQPEIMPVMGSDAGLGVIEAIELLKNAGHLKGEIYWFTDHVSQLEFEDVSRYLNNTEYTLVIFGVGTPTGAPIKLQSGELLKDSSGSIVIPKLNESKLTTLAKSVSGHYHRLTTSDRDINYVTESIQRQNKNAKQEETEITGDQWFDFGAVLSVLALPLFLWFARQQSLFAVGLLIFSASYTNDSYANVIDRLFKNDDQQAMTALQQQKYQDAAALADDPAIKGAALFKQGNLEAAIEQFNQLDSADAFYNKGNALAQLGKLDEAIKAYDQAIKRQPDFSKAQDNKALAEQLKNQQQQQDGQQQQ
ncbi:hypothetical protein DS2_13554, partial [Catenovulum agarivorans DS-2]